MSDNYPENLIINKPSNRTYNHKKEDGLLFFIMVGIWIITLPSILTWVVWFIGILWVDHELFELNGISEIIDQKMSIINWVLVLGMGLILWASIQWIRFSGIDRRKEHLTVSPEYSAQYLKVSTDFIARSRKSSNIKIDFDDDGNILEQSSSID